MESNLRCGQRPRLDYSLSVFGLSAPPTLTMRCCIRTVYASFINTMGGDGLTDNTNTSDLLLDGIIFIAFLAGVGCGWFRLGTNCGPVLLGACGGLALAFMALLLRPGLLFGSFYFANWLLAGPLGAAGAAYTIFRQKFGVVRPISVSRAQVPNFSAQIFGSAASGSFLLVLAIDLILNKQSGMSSGLRLLLDQNSSHVTELQKAGYKPTISTIILAGVGIAAMYVPSSPPFPSFYLILPADQLFPSANALSGKNLSPELKPPCASIRLPYTVNPSTFPQNWSCQWRPAGNHSRRSTSSGYPCGLVRRLTDQYGRSPH